MASIAAPVRLVVVAATLATLATMLPNTDAFAAQSRRKTATEQAADMPAKPVTRGKTTSCAEYGPGFMPVQGTGTCVKIGGAISVGVGGTVR